jgi:succinyl-diaminopimelate desuccinylase
MAKIEKNEAIEILQKFIQIETVNENEEELALYIQELFAEHGIESELVKYGEGRYHVLAEIKQGDSDRIFGLSGHLDVVPVTSPEEWRHEPFGGEIEDGKMYGRGTSDMKSGLAALVIAMINTKEEGRFNGTLRFYGTTDEESGLLGSKHLADLGYAKDLDAILIGEPQYGDVVDQNNGALVYNVISEGISGHSSKPEAGINAIDNLVDYVQAVRERMETEINKEENNDPRVGKLVHTLATIEGGVQSNVIPGIASALFSARTTPTFTNEQYSEILQSVLDEWNAKDGYKLSVEVEREFTPAVGPKDSRLIQVIQQESHEPDVGVTAMAGGTDLSEFQRGNLEMEVAIYGPGEFSQAHVIDEYVYVDSYINFIDTYEKIINGYLA